jgi:sugar lactone lactonase YvrE
MAQIPSWEKTSADAPCTKRDPTAARNDGPFTMRLPIRICILLTAAGLPTLLVPVNARGNGLAFDSSGNLLVLNGKSILKFTPDGTKSTFATLTRIANDLTVDGSGNLLVADSGGAISKFSQDGTKSTFATGLKNPLFVLCDGAGNLFVADLDGRSVFKFSQDGTKSTLATELEPGGLALDASGNLYVPDYGSRSIFKFTPDGTRNTFASGINYPTIAFDPSDNLFVYDSIKRSIFKFTPDGVESTFATGLDLGDNAHCLICDRAGDLFAADRFNSHSIFKFTPDGKKSTLATGIRPFEMAFDGAGNLFVDGGFAIFKFDPEGNQTTFSSNRVSPDKQWEYQCSDTDARAGIVKAGTTQAVLDLSETVPPQWANDAWVVWAPDSKRFAINYRAGGRYNATGFYQLRSDQWVELRSPEDDTIRVLKRAQSAQLAKMHLPKNTHQRRIWDTWKVQKWTDANTAILYAFSDRLPMFNSDRSVNDERTEPGDLLANFLFTLKFDAAGNWKIVKIHQMSEKEAEAEGD